jgi:hypothetical protein
MSFRLETLPLFSQSTYHKDGYRLVFKRDSAWISTPVVKVEVFKDGKLYSTDLNIALNIMNGRKEVRPKFTYF